MESYYRNRTLECTKCKYKKRLHDLLSKGNGRITTSIRGAGDGLICCQEKNIQNYPRKAEDCSVFARDGYKCVPNSQCGRGPPDSGPRNEKPVVIRYGNLGSWVYLRKSIYTLAIKSGTDVVAYLTKMPLCSILCHFCLKENSKNAKNILNDPPQLTSWIVWTMLMSEMAFTVLFLSQASFFCFEKKVENVLQKKIS